MSPYVTVLMAVYNGEMYLKEAIDSILNQTFLDFELIVMNDGSTDTTSDIIKSYSDSRIIYIQNEKIGLVASLNQGLKLAQGKYIVRMDSDDISLPNRIEKQVAFMDANPEIGVSGSWLKTIGDNNEVWSPPATHDEIFVGMLFTVNVYQPTAIIRKNTILNLQEFYKEDFEYVEDMEYWDRLAHLGVKFANIEEVLVKYRFHETSVNKIYHEIQEKKIHIVRLRQLKCLGIDPIEEEMLIYHILMKINSSNSESICKVSQLIIKILKANKKTKIYSNPALSRELAERWFGLCLNSLFNDVSVWTIYFRNPIAMKFSFFRVLFRKVRRRIILLLREQYLILEGL